MSDVEWGACDDPAAWIRPRGVDETERPAHRREGPELTTHKQVGSARRSDAPASHDLVASETDKVAVALFIELHSHDPFVFSELSAEHELTCAHWGELCRCAQARREVQRIRDL